MKIPQYLYHRTSIKSYKFILHDKMIKCCGTPASHWRFKKLKFDKNENDMWRCIFLADSINLTYELTWCGDIILKIKTNNLLKNHFKLDGHVNYIIYGHSFMYFNNILISEIDEVIFNKKI